MIISWGRNPHDEVSALIKESPENFLTPSTMWGHIENMAIYESVRRHLADTKLIGTLILSPQPLELWEINCGDLPATQSLVYCYSSQNWLRHCQYMYIFIIVCVFFNSTSLQKWYFGLGSRWADQFCHYSFSNHLKLCCFDLITRQKTQIITIITG